MKEALCVAARAARLGGNREKFYKYAMKAIVCESCAEICLELGHYYMEIGDYQEAVVWFYNAAFETESMLDIHSGGDKALLGIAECYEREGMEGQAQEYRQQAQEWLASMRDSYYNTESIDNL